jgi:transposase-like protein
MCTADPCPHLDRTPLEETERWQKFLELDKDPDMSVAKIAAALGVSGKTVSRWRARAKRQRRKAARPHPPEVWEQAERFMADEVPLSEIAKTLGISESHLGRKYPDYPRLSRHETGELAVMMKRAKRLFEGPNRLGSIALDEAH